MSANEERPTPTPLADLTPIVPKSLVYWWHQTMYRRHANPAKCLRKCSEPEPCGHIHPCVAGN